jgi:uncharacterized membrane protein YphA (DoxX/SURF4 family)
MSSSGATRAHLLLRVGLAFAFIYPPYAALSDPVSWAAYFPPFVHALPMSTLVLLHAFGALEVAIALWLLSGWRIRVPAALAALMLLGIVAFNWAQLDVLFRDLSLAAVALALVLWPEPRLPVNQTM